MEEQIIRKGLKDFKGYTSFLTEEEYEEARGRLEKLLRETSVSKENIRHCVGRIFPVIAIYKTLGEKKEGALERTRAIFYNKEVYPQLKLLKFFTKIPFAYRLMPKIGYRSMEKSYQQSEDGFQIEIVEYGKEEVAFTVHQCTYHIYCERSGIPELCDVFCTSDDISAEAMGPHVSFHRSTTLGRGGDFCDFRYTIHR